MAFTGIVDKAIPGGLGEPRIVMPSCLNEFGTNTAFDDIVSINIILLAIVVPIFFTGTI